MHFPLFIHIYSPFLLVRRGNYHNPNGLQKMLYCIKNVCAFHSMSLECLMMQWGNVLLELRLFRHCITKISVGIIFNRRIKLYYLISISSTAHHNPKCSKRNEKRHHTECTTIEFLPPQHHRCAIQFFYFVKSLMKICCFHFIFNARLSIFVKGACIIIYTGERLQNTAPCAWYK